MFIYRSVFIYTTIYKSSESEVEVAQWCVNSLPPHGLHSPQTSPDQNTGVGSLSLLQGIFTHLTFTVFHEDYYYSMLLMKYEVPQIHKC